VAEGLRLALEADYANDSRAVGPLGVFEEVRQEPLHSSEAVRLWMNEAQEARKSAWPKES